MISAEYIAGFFDGEGCIDFKRTGQARMIAVRAALTNTNLEFLKLIQIQYGGKIYSKPIKGKPHWKNWNALTWINSEAINFLKLIKPYAFLKLDQIKLAEEYWEFSQTPKSMRCENILVLCKDGKNRSISMRTDETLVIEQEFKDRMHDLNRK